MPSLPEPFIQDPGTRQNFEALAGAFPLGLADLADEVTNNFLKLATVADRKVGFGATSVTFSASTTSNVVTVSHGLGIVPVTVLLTCGVFIIVAAATNLDADSFDVQGYSPAGATSATSPIYWIAIG